MEQLKPTLEENARQWIANGLNLKQIEGKLAETGIEERNIPSLMKEITKLRNARKTTRGLIYILIGAVICLASCVFTIAMPHFNTTFVLYGLTTLGIILVFIGFMQIFN